MAEININQVEADILIAMAKHRTEDLAYSFPGPGESLKIPLISEDKREKFMLDIWRAGVILAKGRYQTRGRQVVILVRLDFGGAPHMNPDGEQIDCPHIHLYREGYGDKWAYPISPVIFPNTDNMWLTLMDFMRYCNVATPPLFQTTLL